MKKILLVTEYLNPPYDEGIKKTVFNLFESLDENYHLRVICRYGFEKENVNVIGTNRLFISRKIKHIISNFSPEILIYFPFASMTFASYLRFFILKKYSKNAKSIIFALQPKKMKNWQERIVNFIKPSVALSPSPQLIENWDKLGWKSKFLPLYTDLEKFVLLPTSQSKSELRKRYNIPTNKYVISHMGHLNEGRNLESLIPLQNMGYQIVIVGSSSTPKDALGSDNLKQKLLDSGIIILNKYIEKIEEIYQLSDLYVFPVVADCSSIGLPLSILEARACGIPVLTTKFGSVEGFLSDDFGNIIFEDSDNFVDVVAKIKNKKKNTSTNVDRMNALYFEIINSEIDK